MESETKEYIKLISRFGKEDWFVGLTSVSLFLFATAVSENFNVIYKEYFLAGVLLAALFMIMQKQTDEDYYIGFNLEGPNPIVWTENDFVDHLPRAYSRILDSIYYSTTGADALESKNDFLA